MNDHETGRSFEHPRHVLDRLGIAARKSLSQNFLCQPAVAARIATSVSWPAATPIVEVGGGTGVLTDAILGRFDDVLVIDVDRTLVGHLRDRYRAERVTVMEADARTVDLALVRSAPMGVFGNLPYAITTDLVMWLIRQRRLLRGAVVMVQREYADRLFASPRTKAYGSLSVFAAFHLVRRGRFNVPKGAFFPAPDVGSAVLSLEFRDPPDDVDAAFLERVVRAAFSHRRKMMRTNLVSELGLDPERVADALTGVAGHARARAEELTPADFAALVRRLR